MITTDMIEASNLFAISYTDDNGSEVFNEYFLSKDLVVWIVEPIVKYGTKDVKLWRWGGKQWYEEDLT